MIFAHVIGTKGRMGEVIFTAITGGGRTVDLNGRDYGYLDLLGWIRTHFPFLRPGDEVKYVPDGNGDPVCWTS